MNFKTLENYINLCKEVRVEPSWEGLKYFSNGKDNTLVLDSKIQKLKAEQRRALDEVTRLETIIKENKSIMRTEIFKRLVKVKYDDRTIYIKYLPMKERSKLIITNNKKIIFIKKTLSKKERQEELHIWLKKKKSIEWYDEKAKEVF